VSSWAWWYTPVILTLRRLRQQDLEFEIKTKRERQKGKKREGGGKDGGRKEGRKD
jgi:hypothetical protein